MKKLLFVAVFAICGLSTINAQGVLNGGLNVGIPTGDASNVSTFTLGAELNYMYTVSDGFTLGPSVQYTHFFGKTVAGVKIKDGSYIPISAAARFNVSDKFVVGANLGYAIGLSNANGGFYYRPVVGYKIADNTQLNLSYSGISDNTNIANIALGVMFGL